MASTKETIHYARQRISTDTACTGACRSRRPLAPAHESVQRAKLYAQAEALEQPATNGAAKQRGGKPTKPRLQATRRANTTIARSIEDYLLDHEGGNHSAKTLEWHRTALGQMRAYFEEERGITLVGEIDAADINAWFASMRKTPSSRGKVRSERTIQTYARSARAFFHWLVRRETIDRNPFDRVVFPKVGKPLIQTIESEEFEQLLLACSPPNEAGPMAERAAMRNRAILWVFYDTGIRVSELCGLRLGDFDRRHGVITVRGKGSKERRVALGANCLRNLLYYLDRHLPGEEELAEWGSAGEEHLFLAETRTPLTKNGVEMLFARIRKRAGINGKRISPHILRHTFAVRYLVLGNDPFSLQELLGHEDMTTVKNYMHMNDATIQEQKRKYSPGDHLPTRMPGPREIRRKGYQAKEQGRASRDRREP
jgi:site-specific recombinase XerD